MGSTNKATVPLDDAPKSAEKLYAEVQRWFVQTRKDEATILHNEIISIINVRKPPLELVSTVLDIIKHEVLADVVKKYYEDRK